MGKILFPKYFPICPADGGDFIVPGYTNAITSNVENTMKMFWRPRKIKVFGSYMQYNGTSRECNTPANYELIIQSPYGSEEEMVCEPVRSWTLASSTNIVDPGTGFSWDSKPFYYVQQDALFALNAFEFQLEQGDVSAGGCSFSVSIKQLYPIEENGGPYDYQIKNILGVNFNMATYVDNITQTGYKQPSVEVTEWWSFGGTYSTTTGNPL
jgi:hypothetical protein